MTLSPQNNINQDETFCCSEERTCNSSLRCNTSSFEKQKPFLLKKDLRLQFIEIFTERLKNKTMWTRELKGIYELLLDSSVSPLSVVTLSLNSFTETR